MSSKQFDHFMLFHQQLAEVRRAARETVHTAASQRDARSVAKAKEWLAGMSRRRPYFKPA